MWEVASIPSILGIKVHVGSSQSDMEGWSLIIKILVRGWNIYFRGDGCIVQSLSDWIQQNSLNRLLNRLGLLCLHLFSYGLGWLEKEMCHRTGFFKWCESSETQEGQVCLRLYLGNCAENLFGINASTVVMYSVLCCGSFLTLVQFRIFLICCGDCVWQDITMYTWNKKKIPDWVCT